MSEPLLIKCISPTTELHFNVKTKKGLLKVNKRIPSLRAALRAFEICQLVHYRPLGLNQMIKLGNYEGLKDLTGEFYLFSNRLEYFIDLGRWIGYFHARGEDVLSKEYINHAIDAFDQMVIKCDKNDPALMFSHAVISDAMVPIREVGEFPMIAPSATVLRLESAWREGKSLRQVELGVLALFANYQPSNLPPLGMIRANKLQIELTDANANEAMPPASKASFVPFGDYALSAPPSATSMSLADPLTDLDNVPYKQGDSNLWLKDTPPSFEKKEMEAALGRLSASDPLSDLPIHQTRNVAEETTFASPTAVLVDIETSELHEDEQSMAPTNVEMDMAQPSTIIDSTMSLHKPDGVNLDLLPPNLLDGEEFLLDL
jgi:hypothetical protein